MLKLELGSEFHKKTVRVVDSRQALYVWERENDLVAVIFDSMLFYQWQASSFSLYIFPNEDEMRKRFSTIGDRDPNDTNLWL